MCCALGKLGGFLCLSLTLLTALLQVNKPSWLNLMQPNEQCGANMAHYNCRQIHTHI